MKILVYGLGVPPFRRGGLVKYSVDLSEQLAEDGNKVTFLYPGKMSFLDSPKCRFSKKEKTNYQFECVELINPLPVSLTFGNSVDVSEFYAYRRKDEIRKFISKVNPDVVHIHTIMGLPIQFLEVLEEKNIRTVYTTHDYYGLCPKMLSNSSLEELQSSKCDYDCMMCKVGPSIPKIKIMQSHFYQRFKTSNIFEYLRKRQRENYKIEDKDYHFTKKQVIERYRLRKYYLNLFNKISVFHFNSSIAENVFRQYLPNVKGKTIPLVIKGLKKETRSSKIERIAKVGFLGGVDRKKGFFLLKEVLSELKSEGIQFEVLCAGSNADDSFFEENYVKNLGIISSADIEKFYKQIDILIVPSICHETFGLVVIEATTRGIPVLCSNTVGAKDLIPSNYVFKDKKELAYKLKEFIMSVNTRNKAIDDFRNIDYDVNFRKHMSIMLKNFY